MLKYKFWKMFAWQFIFSKLYTFNEKCKKNEAFICITNAVPVAVSQEFLAFFHESNARIKRLKSFWLKG